MQAQPARAILGGFLGTAAMTLLMYGAPMMGMPKMDIAAMLGSMVGGSWTLGMVLHFLNGTVIFALFYAYVMYRILPGSPAVRGMLWGVILWLMAEIVVMPMMGNGVFSSATPAPMMMVMGILVGHLLYGGILGAVAGVQATDAIAQPAGHRA